MPQKNSNALLFLLVFIITIITCYAWSHRHKHQILIRPQVIPFVPKPPPEKIIPIVNQPEWTNYPAVRQPSGDTVLLDIESHLRDVATYKESDLVTSAHECSHGIASEIRNKYASQGHINGFYCLQNRAVIIQEPSVKITTVAQVVPQSLRGETYNLYLIKGASRWNSEPLYLLDEFVSYTNGSNAGIDLAEKNQWHYGRRADTIQFMLEFNVYTIALAKIIHDDDKSYNDSQFKSFLMWSLTRSMSLYNEASKYSDFHNDVQDAYWFKFQTSPDSLELRTFAKSYFGETWTKNILGF